MEKYKRRPIPIISKSVKKVYSNYVLLSTKLFPFLQITVIFSNYTNCRYPLFLYIRHLAPSSFLHTISLQFFFIAEKMRINGYRLSLILSITLSLLSAFTINAAAPFSCDQSNPSTKSLPFCNTELPIAARVKDLISRLTLDEKVQQLVNGAAAVPRLNISAYEWWSEALHGVSRHGKGFNFKGEIKSATMFPQIILTAASFDSNLWYRIAQVHIYAFLRFIPQITRNSYCSSCTLTTNQFSKHLVGNRRRELSSI